jgi:tRNA/rRNA methyltransferase
MDIPHQSCSVVLVRTKFAGNLGSVARAMANFGVTDLRLVTPEASPAASEARALASHGEPLLDQARTYPSLREAVADCVWVCATSARQGGLYRKQNTLDLKEAVLLGKTQAVNGPIAFVFGPEDHGLTNDEISLCHHLLHINTCPEYGVLNLAQAAVICLYEWYQCHS